MPRLLNPDLEIGSPGTCLKPNIFATRPAYRHLDLGGAATNLLVLHCSAHRGGETLAHTGVSSVP